MPIVIQAAFTFYAVGFILFGISMHCYDVFDWKFRYALQLISYASFFAGLITMFSGMLTRGYL